MRLVWARPELQRLCHSTDGLARLCPRDIADARLLLAMVASAATLFELSRFQCIDLTIEQSAVAVGLIAVTVRLVEVTLKGTPITAATGAATAPVGGSAWMRSVEALLVGEVGARSDRAIKASV